MESSRRWQKERSPQASLARQGGINDRKLRLELLESRLVLSTNPTAHYSQVDAVWFEQVAPVALAPITDGHAEAIPSDRWIVRLSPKSLLVFESVADAAEAISSSNAGLQVVRGLGLPGQLLVNATGLSEEEVREAFASNPHVSYFDKDSIVRGSITPDDPDFTDQVGLGNTGQEGGQPGADIDAQRAWDIATGSRDVVVAIIDSGVDYHHDDLAANIWTNLGESGLDENGKDKATNNVDDDGNGFVDDVRGWDFMNDDNSPLDDHGHGTHVAGIVGAEGNNTEGVTGVAWKTSIMPLKFLGEDNQGPTSGAIEAINYATMMRQQHGVNVRVTNNSWGSNTLNIGLRDAIAASDAADILFIGGAGNGNIFGGVSNDSIPFYPASYGFDNIISVASSDRIDELAQFSNFGLTTVDLTAPGVGIASTSIDNTYRTRSGTSMAAPHVTGVAALLFSENPGATSAEVKDAILSGVDAVPNLAEFVGSGGRLNAFGALSIDTFSPTPTLVSAPNVTLLGSFAQPIEVRLSDGTSVDGSTFDDLDLVVTRLNDNGDTFTTSFTGADFPGDGRMRIARYEMDPPGGAWDPADNGTYQISLVAGQVGDTLGNQSLATNIGTFEVAVNNPGEFFVDSPLDTGDANPGDGNAVDADGNRTLRAAIQESNSMSGDNTIFVAAGNFTLSIDGIGEDLAAAGDLDITDTVGTLTIVGAGADKTRIDGAGLDRIFDLRPGVNVSLAGVTLVNGVVTGDGGAIRVEGSTLTIADAAVTDNRATLRGGGLFANTGSTVDVVRSTFAENSSETDGGAIGNLANLKLTNVTVSTNTASGNGGGIHNAGGTAALVHSTLTRNASLEGGGFFSTSGFASLRNTLVAENEATTNPDVAGAFTSLNNNLIGDRGTATVSVSAGDQIGTAGSEVAPNLSPLQYNHGPTRTHLPLPGSPAIDQGDNSGATITDQRMIARPQDGDNDTEIRVDIGAVERYFVTISGVHFHDLDEDNERGEAEPGLEGWTIYVDENANQQFDTDEPFAVTDSEGRYTITGVEPGNRYQVRIQDQAGWVQTAPNATTREFLVDSLSDAIDATPLGDGLVDVDLDMPGTQVTLRAAIQEANASVGPDIITLGAGVYELTIAGTVEDVAATGDLDVTDHLDIVGAGADVTIIDATNLGDRVFDIFGGNLVTISGVTILGGTGVGSGISGTGGGILNRGDLTIASTVIDGNTSDNEGGGLRNLSTGVATIVDSTFSNNSARRGGGIHNEGSLNIVGSTFSANSTDSGNNRRGGAIYHESGGLAVEATTVTNNTAEGEAGGVYVQAGSNATATNTVFAGNTSTSTGDHDVSGTFLSLGNNLIGDVGSATGFVADDTSNDLVNVMDPMLGPLQNNGGTTFTHEPLAGSPLIDAGNNAISSAFDQRGRRRIIDGDANSSDVVDIGALEFFDGFIVNTIDDSVDANPGDGLAENAAGLTSLRAAIMEANALSGDNSILLAASTYRLSLTGVESNDSSVGDLDIVDNSGSLTIVGAGVGKTTIDANRIDRVIEALPGSALNLRDLTITGGGAATSDQQDGAGIYNHGGSLALDRISIVNNTTSQSGGGVFHAAGSLEIEQSTIAGNSADLGGGIFAGGGTVNIDKSTLSGNSANNGAGIYATDGTLTVLSSTVSGNTATSQGGGVFNDATVSILHTTITDNSANNPDASDGVGGGVYNVDGMVTLEHSIVAGNTRLGTTSLPDDISGANVTGSFNLIGDAATAGGLRDKSVQGASVNTVGNDGSGVIDPMLAPLSNNGGPTQTHAPLFGSPAIDAGDSAFDPNSTATPLNSDQRGAPFDRKFGPRIDIGSHEFDLTPVAPDAELIVDLAFDLVDGDVTADNLSLREAIFLSNVSPGVQTIRFDASLNGRTMDLLLGELSILDEVVIDASSLTAGVTIDANFQSRVINYRSLAGDLTLIGLTLINGRTTLANEFSTEVHSGGGIRFFSVDTLALINSSLMDSGTVGDGADGGGIFTSAGNVLLTNSTVSGNYTLGDSATGGGISTNSGSVFVTSSTIRDNSTHGELSRGGGIRTADGSVYLSGSTLSGNSTVGERSVGGGIRTDGGAFVVSSTVSGNSTEGALAHGGGIFSSSGISLTSSTVTENLAGGIGGGFFENTSSANTFVVLNSIVAGNMDGGSAPDFRPAPGRTLSVSHSLIGDNRGTQLDESQIVDPEGNQIGSAAGDGVINPLLAPLTNNGGPTETHALLPGSPAIDAGGGDASPFDQRGFNRVEDGDGDLIAISDIGAFELASQQDGIAAALASAIGIPGIDVWTVTTGPGNVFENIDFGAHALLGEIRGQVFHDVNGDGTNGTFEPGLIGWEIYLDENENLIHDSGEPITLSDVDGNYVFTNLESARSYQVATILQSGWVQTFPTETLSHWEFELGPGETRDGVDFGNATEIASGVDTGVIEGVVFNDLNGSGVPDGQPGVSGVKVFLDLDDNGIFDSGEPNVVTADGTAEPLGSYQFLDRPPGEYTVRVLADRPDLQTSPAGIENRPLATSLTTESQPTSVATGDFNRDGHLDLAVVNARSTTLSLFYSDTNGSFLTPTVITVGAGPLSIQVAQFNDDNGDMLVDENDHLDLVVGYTGTNFISVLFNDTVGGFDPIDLSIMEYTTPFAPWYLAPGDFDGDGDNDVFSVHLNQSTVSFLERTPSGFVATTPAIDYSQTPDRAPASIIAVQFNDDNGDLVVDESDRLDLAWVDVHPDSSTVTALFNDGDGTYTAVSRKLTGRPYAVTSGDFDGDGFSDLAVTIPETDQVAILLNDQDGNFGLPSFISNLSGPVAITSGDLDGDLDVDIAITNASDRGLVFLRNDGDGNFVAENSGVAAFPSTLAVSIVAAQLDDDSSLDVAVANGQGAESVLFYSNRIVNSAQRVVVPNGTPDDGVNFGVLVDPVSADFDADGDVDGTDFLIWQRGFSTSAPNASKSDGDADNDQDVDAADLAIWLSQIPTTTNAADFDRDGDVDGTDFLAWQRGFGTAFPNAEKSDGDADNDQDVDAADLAIWINQISANTSSADFDGDGDVDGTDFLIWQQGFGTTTPNASRSNGDADNDQDVDAADLAIWLSQIPNNADPADFDRDGDVDGADFLAWQRGFGTNSLNAEKSDGDADNDQDVDAADLDFWLNRFGQANTVSEIGFPASLEQTSSAPTASGNGRDNLDQTAAIRIDDPITIPKPVVSLRPMQSSHRTQTPVTPSGTQVSTQYQQQSDFEKDVVYDRFGSEISARVHDEERHGPFEGSFFKPLHSSITENLIAQFSEEEWLHRTASR